MASRKTASNTMFNSKANAAALTYLPLGSRVTVCRTSNGRCVRDVRIDDRGPFLPASTKSRFRAPPPGFHLTKSPRVIDLTPAVARQLGFTMKGAGVTDVVVIPTKWGNGSIFLSGKKSGKAGGLYYKTFWPAIQRPAS